MARATTKRPSVQDSAIASPVSSSERFRRRAVEIIPLSDDSCLVHPSLAGDRRLLPARWVRVLSACDSFRTLDQHAYQLSTDPKLTEMSAVEVRQVLSQLAEARLLVSDRELRRALEGQRSSLASGNRIVSIGIGTRDRPSTLRRALTSYIRNTQRHERAVEFVVVDDSTSGDICRQNRQMLAASQKEQGCKILYVGPRQRSSFARQLAAATGLPAELARFAVKGDAYSASTAGATRNVMLLGTVGKRLLLVDDDTVCQTASPFDRTPGLRLSSERDPTEFWFFPNRAATLEAVSWKEEDYLASHERLLGREVSDCLRTVAADEPVEFDPMSARMERRLQTFGGRVLATSTSIVGDSGIGASAYLFLGPNSHGRVTESEANYRRFVLSRQVLRSVTQTTISEGTFCMGGNLGLDNSDILPPFMPVERGEDTIFGVTLRKCFLDAYMGFLPCPLLHDPPAGRSHSFRSIWEKLEFLDTSSIILQGIRAFRPGPVPSSPRDTLCRLGLFLEDLGSMPLTDFEEFLRVEGWRNFSSLQYHMGETIHSPEVTPPFLAKYLKKYLNITRRSVLRPEYVVPRNMVKQLGFDEARRASQRRMREFGELLRAWPEVIAYVKSRQSEERHFLVP